MIVHSESFEVRTPEREVLLDVTGRVEAVVSRAAAAGAIEGACRVFVPHTTAGITINENADPAVKRDLVRILRDLVPVRRSYEHVEGNSDAHAKASLVGFSVDLIVTAGRLLLGTWQGVTFCEFDGPRTRRVHVQVFGVGGDNE